MYVNGYNTMQAARILFNYVTNLSELMDGVFDAGNDVRKTSLAGDVKS